MGTPMATNALRAGFDLMVFDLREEQVRALARDGARPAKSAREVGEHGEVIQVAVPDDDAVIAAILGKEGVLAGASPGTIVVIHSTIHPRTVRAVAEQAQERGVQVLDAQMTGARQGAVSQSLLFMVGGDAQALERCRPVLAASASNIIHMGPLGMGAVTKAAQQAITVVNLLAATEGIRLALAAGVELEAFYEVLALSTAQSYIADNRMGFPPELGGAARSGDREARPFYRGLRAVLRLAFDLDVPMPATALAQQTVPWALAAQPAPSPSGRALG